MKSHHAQRLRSQLNSQFTPISAPIAVANLTFLMIFKNLRPQGIGRQPKIFHLKIVTVWPERAKEGEANSLDRLPPAFRWASVGGS